MVCDLIFCVVSVINFCGGCAYIEIAVFCFRYRPACIEITACMMGVPASQSLSFPSVMGVPASHSLCVFTSVMSVPALKSLCVLLP